MPYKHRKSIFFDREDLRDLLIFKGNRFEKYTEKYIEVGSYF